jgi:UPF0755 protein
MENSPLLNNPDFPIHKNSQISLLLKVLLVLTAVAFVIYTFYFLFLSAPIKFPNSTTINIEQGESLRSLSKNLKEIKIIRSRAAFESFVILLGGEKHIAPGDYLFEKRLPVYEVARRIVQKDRRLAPIKVTIPEGYDNMQISELFSLKLKNFNKENFLVEAKGQEGYLFPDTYFFFTNDNEKDVLKYLSENFLKKIKSVQAEIDSSDRTEKEIIIMASLIEREAKGDNDRGIISGILWNRIRSNMPLQIDAVTATYKTKGLPESPICNPGLAAIKAALNPTPSAYFYYLHDKNGLIHYAKTFTEHKKNIAKYLKN